MPLIIFTINDVYELTNFPVLKSLVDGIKRSLGPENTYLFVLNGDFTSPSQDKGLSMIIGLNMLGITHVCLGNHEFDHPESIELIKTHAKFKVLNTNISGLDFPTHDIVDDCLLLGGCTPQDVPIVPVGVKINPVNESLIEFAKGLEDTGYHFKRKIALTHQVYSEDRKIKQSFDLILGGHEHDYQIEFPIVKMGMNAECVGVVNVDTLTFSCHPVDGHKGINTALQKYIDRLDYETPKVCMLPILKVPSLSTLNIRTSQSNLVQYFMTQIMDYWNVDAYIINSGKFRNINVFIEMTLQDFYKMFSIRNGVTIITVPRSVVYDCIDEGLKLSGTGRYVQYGFRHETLPPQVQLIVTDFMCSLVGMYSSLKPYIPQDTIFTSLQDIILQLNAKEILSNVSDYYECVTREDLCHSVCQQSALLDLIEDELLDI